jgi:hypothetical protein
MNREGFIFPIVDRFGQFAFDLATGLCSAVSFARRFCRVQRDDGPFALAPFQSAMVAGSLYLANVLVALRKAAAGDSSSLYADAPRCAASSGLCAAEAKLHCPCGHERGMELCR